MATPLSQAQLRANNDAFLAAVQTGKSTEDALAAIPHPPTQGFRAAHAADPDHYDLDRYKEWALRGIVPDDVDNFVTGEEYDTVMPRPREERPVPTSFAADVRRAAAVRRAAVDPAYAGTMVGNWSEEEHAQFLELMEVHGRSWTKIARCMDTRTELCRNQIAALLTDES